MIPWVISGWKEEAASRQGGGGNHGQGVDEDEYMIWVSCVCCVVLCMPSSFVGSLFLNSNSKFVT